MAYFTWKNGVKKPIVSTSNQIYNCKLMVNLGVKKIKMLKIVIQYSEKQ